MWPLPEFVHRDLLHPELHYLRTYDEKTLMMVRQRKVSPERAAGHPQDGLAGYGAVEIGLRKLLDQRGNSKRTISRKRPLAAANRAP